MQTFSLDICKRLAQTLGDKCPKTPFILTLDPDWPQAMLFVKANNKNTSCWDEKQQCQVRFPNNQIVPAFSIADLDAKAWQAIGEKLGWDAASPFARAWVDEPIAMYRAWLTGGYEAADKYLNSILPK